MELPDPVKVADDLSKNPRKFAFGLIGIFIIGVVGTVGSIAVKWVLEPPGANQSSPKPATLPAKEPSVDRTDTSRPRTADGQDKMAANLPGRPPSESPTDGSGRLPTPLPAPIRASVPPPAAPQQAAVEAPAAPVAPRAPEPPLPCAQVTLPIKPAALATSADRVCAIAVCTGQPADAPAIDAVRKWLALARAKAGAKCDVADREALGDDAVLKRLLAIAATEPATKKGDERLSCFDAREAINDELQKASEKLQTSIDDAKRCGAKAQKETSDAVSAVVQALQ